MTDSATPEQATLGVLPQPHRCDLPTYERRGDYIVPIHVQVGTVFACSCGRWWEARNPPLVTRGQQRVAPEFVQMTWWGRRRARKALAATCTGGAPCP